MHVHLVTRRFVVALVWLALSSSMSAAAGSSKVTPDIQKNLAASPLAFEINQGQADDDVRLVARGLGYQLLLTEHDAVLGVSQKSGLATTTMRFGDGHAGARVEPLDRLPGEINYLLGNDPSKWRRNVPHFARVRYRDVYPGVDVIFYGNQERLEYDLVVSPGADPSKIALQFDGAAKLSVDVRGSLILDTPAGRIEQDKPVIYQATNGEKAVLDGHYVLKGGNAVGFEVDSYDATRPLVIDPVISFSYHGVGGDEARAIAIDSVNNVYIAGMTTSLTLPRTTSPFQSNAGGGKDGFVTKFSAGSHTMVFSTYIGGVGDDIIRDIAVGGRAGNLWITGETTSPNFPLFLPGQGTNAGGIDAFIAKFNVNGNGLDFSTLLGGSGDDRANGITLMGDDSVFVAGATGSPNFPIIDPLQAIYGGGPTDAFFTQFSSSGGPPIFSTFMGGKGADEANDIVMNLNNTVVWSDGQTQSADFPMATGGAEGDFDAFVVGFGATAAVRSGPAGPIVRVFGGSADDIATGLAIAPNGVLGVSGQTASSNFLTQNGAQPSFGGGATDGFITLLQPNASGSLDILNSTFLGGTGADSLAGIASNPQGLFFGVGRTDSRDVRFVSPLQGTYAGGDGDCFFFLLGPNGSPVASSFFGGPGLDGATAAVYDPSSNTWYMTGLTANPAQQIVGFLAQFTLP